MVWGKDQKNDGAYKEYDKVFGAAQYLGNKEQLIAALKSEIEELSRCAGSERVKFNLHSSLALDKSVLDAIFSAHKNVVINVMYDENDLAGRRDYGVPTLNGVPARMAGPVNTYMYSKEETKAFVDNYNYIRKKYGGEIVINDEFTVKQAVDATNKVNDWAEKILNARVNGRELTPFEKYLMAYQIVSHFGAYKEYPIGGNLSRQSRDLVSVLNSDYIVCAGYAKLLTELCVKVGINCSCQLLKGHEMCTFDIDDKEYGVSGRFLSDPTRNSFIDKSNPADVDLAKAIMTYEYGKKAYQTDIFDKNKYFNYAAEDVLGVPFEAYKVERLKQFLGYIDDHSEEKKDYVYKLDERVLDGFYDEAFATGNFEKLIDFGYKSTDITKDQFKELVKKKAQKLEFNPIYYTEQQGKFALARAYSAVMPTPESLLSAYERTLQAEGINTIEERAKIIRETIAISGCDAFRGSYFYGFSANDSVAAQAFEAMVNGLGSERV